LGVLRTKIKDQNFLMGGHIVIGYNALNAGNFNGLIG
jgi:hypothetical protein